MSLKSKIETNKAVVSVIGLGYVGLPLLAAFHRAGFPTLGFDVDPRKIDALKKGESYLKHLGPELVTGLHPVFGDIGVDGWDRLHVRHFEHHFTQFGV